MSSAVNPKWPLIPYHLLIVGWLCMLLWCFWWFFERNITNFDRAQLYSDKQITSASTPLVVPGLLQNLLQKIQFNHFPAKNLVIHWLDTTCPCYRFAKIEIQQLISNQKAGTKHLMIFKNSKFKPANSSDKKLFANANVIELSQAELLESQRFIPATPAVTIITSTSDHYSYLGPHSSGLICGKGESFVELTLNNLAAGFDPQFININQSGCFCDW